MTSRSNFPYIRCANKPGEAWYSSLTFLLPRGHFGHLAYKFILKYLLCQSERGLPMSTMSF